MRNGQANTALTHHSRRTYALLESDLPFNVQIEKTGKFDLKSQGHDDFDGQLDHQVSAHPKIDAKTGQFFAFGYDLTGKVHISIFDK